MKKVLLSLCLLMSLGCATAKSPTPPLAPGYSNLIDQQVGESLAAVNAFVNAEKTNYAAMSAERQAKEKPYLNGLITATNLANASYLAFHTGTQTLQQAQQALANAQAAQAALAQSKGVN